MTVPVVVRGPTGRVWLSQASACRCGRLGLWTLGMALVPCAGCGLPIERLVWRFRCPVRCEGSAS